MPNTYFRFKQFTVYQDKCAMKVCTDSCIFGAWAAKKISEKSGVKNILDLGCGTGLLSLMLAQQSDASIDAVDINIEASKQATENILQSPWKNRVQVFNKSLQEFQAGKNYDVIICNPPFYENDLKSTDENKNSSKHDSTLRLDELVFYCKNNLAENGIAFILIPFHRSIYLEELLNKNSLFISEKLFIRQSPVHDFFRSVFMISAKKTKTIESELTIHDSARNYSPEFMDLLKPYYLAFK